MKLLHVIPTLSPASGGPAEAVRQLVRWYPEFGVEAEIVCQDEPGDDWLPGFAAPIHPLGGRGVVYGRSPVLRAWLAGNVARYDGVVAHALWTYAGLAASRAARRVGVPYAVFTHGMLDPWFNRRYPLKRIKKQLYWPIQYPVLHHAKAVLFTSEIERDLAPQSFWPHHWNGRVVPYGTSEPPAEPEAQRAAFAALTPQLAERRFLLFLSRIHEKKGCDLLVEAFASVASAHPDVDLVIAGPDRGGLQAKLMAQAERLGVAARVHWPGMLTGAAKWGALRSCEAMVLPSHQENFGVVVAEALACARPVLISNQVNLWPQIEEDRVGLVEPDTREGTRNLLARWLALGEDEKSAMGARALAAFRRRYSMRNCAAAIRNLFES